MILILLVSYYNFLLVNLVFVSLSKIKKFKVKSHFVKCKHGEGIYLVCELRSA